MKKLKILFVCIGNSCRSQMAEGWANHLKGDVVEAYSAGIETHGVDPFAVEVMAEVGVDISHQRCEHIDELMTMDFDFDVVVTVCSHAHEHCPLLPRPAHVVHVGFGDPPALARQLASQGATDQEQLQAYRDVRDEIKAYVETLPDSLHEGVSQNL
jgi:arsenate reductase